MGYTTDFEGAFQLDKPLAQEHYAYLIAFSDTRRMKRDAARADMFPDPIRRAVNLSIGVCGAYYVGASGMKGQDGDDSVIDYNSPPNEQPGLWNDWVPTGDRLSIHWNGSEKFYGYVEWIEYIIQHFLEPWGYKLNGEVMWKGESISDIGKITIKDNIVSRRSLHLYGY
jgi:hypothetical protein